MILTIILFNQEAFDIGNRHPMAYQGADEPII